MCQRIAFDPVFWFGPDGTPGLAALLQTRRIGSIHRAHNRMCAAAWYNQSTMIELIGQHREQIAEICRRHQVRRLELFGSAARGDFDRTQGTA